MYLKQSTAYTFRHGPFLDETDGKTAETGLTISNTDIRVSKNGGNFIAKNESTSASHDEIGYYIVILDTTDTNTCGELLIAVHESGALPVFKTFQVLEEHIYDALFAANAAAFDANHRVDVSKIEGGGAISTLDARVAAILADTNELQGDLANGGRLDLLIDSIISKVDVVDGIVDDILVDTAVIGAAGAGLTDLGGMSTGMKAEVNVECDASMVTYGMDHLLSASVADGDVTDNSVFAMLVSKESTAGWDDYVHTTDSLQALRDRGDASWVTGAGGTPPQLMQNTTIASLASQTSFTLTAGSADDDAYNDGVIVITDQSTGVQKAHGTISDYTGSSKTVTLGADPGIFTMATGDTVDIIAPLGSGGGGSAPTAAAVADAVWDEATSGHTTSGTFGEQLKTDVDAILADTNELQSDDIPGSLSTISGKVDAVDDLVDTEVAAIKTVVDSILVDTNELQSDDIPGTLTTMTGKIDTIDGIVDNILVDTGTTLDGKLDTIDNFIDTEVASIISKVDVIDGIVDSILVDTAVIGVAGAGLTAIPASSTLWTTSIAESYAADGAAATPAQLLYQIYCAVGEFSISGTTITGKRLDGSTTAMTWTLDDASSPTSRTRAS